MEAAEIQIDPNLAAQAQARKDKARKAALSRKSYGNQYTTGVRESPDVATRDKVRAELAAAKLERHIQGSHKMSSTQVAAAKILVDKGKPSLQAIEQTVIEPAVIRSEPELLSALRELMAAHPDLVQQILGEQAKSSASAQPSLVNALQADAAHQSEKAVA